jgi:hypothetical protein
MQNKPEISYVTKNCIYPAFGKCYKSAGVIVIRQDLPSCVKKYVLAHELAHLVDDKYKSWIAKEIFANWRALKRHPIGFVVAAVISLAPARLWFYAKRVRKGQ